MTKRFPSSIGHAACLNHPSDGTRKRIRSRTVSFRREFRDTRYIGGAMQIRKVRRRCNDILAINRRLAHRAGDKLLSDGRTGSVARPGNSAAAQRVAMQLYNANGKARMPITRFRSTTDDKLFSTCRVIFSSTYSIQSQLIQRFTKKL